MRGVAATLGLSEVALEDDRRSIFLGKQLDHLYVRGLELVEAQAMPVPRPITTRSVPCSGWSMRPPRPRRGHKGDNPSMSQPLSPQEAEAEIARLVGELESAEAFEQRLRQLISDVRDTLARGHVERALSMLNDALRVFDDQTDVVAPHDAARPRG
jgi:hypothetical protein